MSINMYVSRSQQQASSVASCRDERVANYFQLREALNDFVVYSKELEGQAYSSAKDYYRTVLLPLVRGGELLTRMVAEATGNFPKEYIDRVDSGDLIEWKLLERIAELDALIQEATTLLQEAQPNTKDTTPSSPYAARLNTYKATKQELKEKLQRLYNFNDLSPSIFADIESLKVSLAEGLACTQDAWDSQRGVFVIPPPEKLQWVTSINKMRVIFKRCPDVYTEAYNLYGGRQSGPSNLYETTKDPTIEKIVRKYHPDMSERGIHTFLKELNSEGCGYTACVNTFLNQYSGSEEDFEQEFGFPLYRSEGGQKRINFEYLLVDFYAAWDNPDAEGITPQEGDELFTKYLNEHGVNASFINDVDGTMDNYKKYSKEGEVIVAVYPARMINAATGEEYNGEAGHAMTVTGTKVIDGVEYLVVSSWGEKFYLNPEVYAASGERCEFQVVSYD